MVKTRDPYLDFVKGILILLVIFGHMLEISEGTVGDVIYHFIYFFHMPLFVLISGYFTKPVQSIRLFMSRNTGLLETLIFFQGILILMGLLQGKEFSWHSIVTPVWAMWYMLSLFSWRLLVTIINPSKYSIHICIIVSLLLCLLAGYLPFSYIASFQRTFYFFPFFMIGHCLGVKKKSLQECCLSVKKSIFVLLGAFLGCIYIAGYKNYSFEGLLYGSYCYNITRGVFFNGGDCLIMRLLILLCSCLISLAFLSPLKDIRAPQWLVRVGEQSLFFYIYHIFAVIAFRFVSRFLELPLSVPFILVYTVILFGVLYVLSGNKLMVKLLNPITNFRK